MYLIRKFILYDIIILNIKILYFKEEFKMKKYTVILIIPILLIVLCSCSQKADISSSSASPSLPAVSQPVNSQSSIEFTPDIMQYFNEDVDAALATMDPMLKSACIAEVTYLKSFIATDKPFDSDISWMIVYNLYNSYGYNDSGVTQKSDGTLVVTKSSITNTFKNVFVSFSGNIPEVSSDLSGTITIDSNKNYALQRSDPPEYEFQLKNVTLSYDDSGKAYSAIIAINLLDIEDKQMLDTVYVEVIKNDSSIYKYSILSTKVTTYAD